ncbi:MAG: translation initiation factor IF-2 N-terminal domain-containing protein, partial [Octadecabacter sp.]|nr:translation initiation factor IF-2 N-terminal domain-containing protein [Octadecabacter sp.]
MSDTDGKKPLGVGGPRPGSVKQSFSHGRTKSVVVETKRKRVVVPKPGAAKPASGASAAPIGGDPSKRPAGISDVELERRMKALAAAKAREAEDAAKREAEEKARAEERERRRAEQEAKEREEREREEAVKAKKDEEERKKREAEVAAQAAAAPAAVDPELAPAQRRAPPSGGAPTATPRKKEDDRENRGRNKGDDDGRRSGKLTLNQALRGGEGGRQRSMAQMKRKQDRARQKAMGQNVEREKVMRDVQLPEAIVVSELANRMAEKVSDVVKALMNNGIMATQNQTIDADTAELIIDEFGHRVVRVSDADVEDVIKPVEDKADDLQSRPPVITIMGHVDHGKT